jgi:shikimate kinase
MANKSYRGRNRPAFKMQRSVAVLGMRGVGKSTVCSKLAAHWNAKLISVDDEIVKINGKTIDKVVKEFGWPYFREQEYKVLQQVVENKEIVLLDPGGGILENSDGKISKEKIDILTEKFFILYMTMEQHLLKERVESVRESKNRPGLPGDPTFEELYQRRHEANTNIADTIVDISYLTPAESVDRIHQLIHGKILKTV